MGKKKKKGGGGGEYNLMTTEYEVLGKIYNEVD